MIENVKIAEGEGIYIFTTIPTTTRSEVRITMNIAKFRNPTPETVLLLYVWVQDVAQWDTSI
jgi:hypothetical protein